MGAPWTSKRPLTDLVADATIKLEPQAGIIRIMVGHGAVDQFSPNRDNPAVINVGNAEKALNAGKFHYLALGDRHSLTDIGSSGRIFYSGTHEAYDFGHTTLAHKGRRLFPAASQPAASGRTCPEYTEM